MPHVQQQANGIYQCHMYSSKPMAYINATCTAASQWHISMPHVQQQANGIYQCHMYSSKPMAYINATCTAASQWHISMPHVQQQANGIYQCHMYSSKLMAYINATCTAASQWQISMPHVQQQANGKYRCHTYSSKLMANIGAIRIAASDPTCLPSSPSSSTCFWRKLQALVYDIVPSTTAVFSYVIGSWKLSADEQFFVGAQIVISLRQTIQIKQGLSFIAANKVFTSTNKTTIVWIETLLFSFLFTQGWMRLMFTWVLGR